MPVYVAVDFHAREQTISWFDTADEEVHRTKLRHQRDDVRKFYEQFRGEVIAAFEPSGYRAWFEQMLAELVHTVWLGIAAEIKPCTNSPSPGSSLCNLCVLCVSVVCFARN